MTLLQGFFQEARWGFFKALVEKIEQFQLILSSIHQ